MKIKVKVHPNSAQNKIKKDNKGKLHLYLTETPVKGRANLAAIEALADYLKIKKSQIFLSQGVKSKNKTFEIFKGV